MRENSSAADPDPADREIRQRELWRDVLLDHFRDPRGRTPLAQPSCRREVRNPLCGDRLVLELTLAEDRVREVSARARGCSLSVASASMLAERLPGLTIGEVRDLSRTVQAYLTASADPAGEIDLGEIEALGGVRRLAARRPCALLPWRCLDTLLGEDAGVSNEPLR